MSTNRDFFMTIPDAYQDDWELFIKKADIDETYPADILLDFMREFVDEHRSELVEDSDERPRKVVVKKAAPKKKSFLARKAKIIKKKEADGDEDSPDITQTPKFRLLELVRQKAGEDGIAPETLIAEADSASIPRPRLQMNKMIRRGILYIHEGKVHVT
ncbi:MAG: hypothetical protein VXX45_02850 [Candidatus Thermoplasmatota archaeon]|nr:hypothetical protein [Candidatus Thermoplasmatota archaeon]